MAIPKPIPVPRKIGHGRALKNKAENIKPKVEPEAFQNDEKKKTHDSTREMDDGSMRKPVLTSVFVKQRSHFSPFASILMSWLNEDMKNWMNQIGERTRGAKRTKDHHHRFVRSSHQWNSLTDEVRYALNWSMKFEKISHWAWKVHSIMIRLRQINTVNIFFVSNLSDQRFNFPIELFD